jgi:hypothetical protein
MEGWKSITGKQPLWNAWIDHFLGRNEFVMDDYFGIKKQITWF